MRRLNAVLLALMIAALTSVGLVACGDEDDDEGGGGGEDTSAASFDLGVTALVPLTGDLAAYGPAGEKAASLAADEATAALKEAGADVTLTYTSEDTQTTPQGAQSAAEKAISGGANCLTGPWASGEVVPVGRSVAARQEIPLISPSATAAEITDLPDDGFVFRTAPSDGLQAQALVDAIEADEGGTDAVLSIAARNDPYGEGIATAVAEIWESSGGTTTGDPLLYDLDLSSYNSEASDVVSDSPDLFVIVDFEEPYNRLGAALLRTGDFDATRLWTTDGLAFEEGVSSTSIPLEALAGASGSRPSGPEQEPAAAKAFEKLYTSAPGPKRNTFDVQNFDAVSLCVLAAVAAGSNEGPAIAEQLQAVSGPPGDKYDYTQMTDAITALQAGEDIDFEGASGPLDFDENGEPAIGFYELFEYDDKGEFSVTESVTQEAE